MSRARLASALTALIALSALTMRVHADEPPALPSRLPTALDRALSSPLSLPARRVEVMGRAGGTALLVVGSVMAGGGWLVSNAGLLAPGAAARCATARPVALGHRGRASAVAAVLLVPKLRRHARIYASWCAGGMFWLCWKTLSGSYLRLMAASFA